MHVVQGDRDPLPTQVPDPQDEGKRSNEKLNHFSASCIFGFHHSMKSRAIAVRISAVGSKMLK